MRKYLGLAVLPLFLAWCPSLLAVNYTWNFTGSGGTNCPTTKGSGSCADPGNTLTFNATTPGAPAVTVTVSAWYVNASGKLQSATLGQYASGLGVCYAGATCSGSSEEVGNSSKDEFVLFQFSAPVDPTSISLGASSKDAGVSYWLGTTANQTTNLAGMNLTTSLSTLGFGAQDTSTGGKGTTSTIDFGGAPSTTVNAVLFGAMYGDSGDYFDISGMSGSTIAASVPEPASIFLLFTVIVAALRIRGGHAVPTKHPSPSGDIESAEYSG